MLPHIKVIYCISENWFEKGGGAGEGIGSGSFQILVLLQLFIIEVQPDSVIINVFYHKFSSVLLTKFIINDDNPRRGHRLSK
jgi:hypothetical protein